MSIVGVKEKVAAQVVTNTTLSAASGALSTFFIYPLIKNVIDDKHFRLRVSDFYVCDLTNGMLAGLVSATAAADSLSM